jgi:hypothetical protein
MLRSIRSAALRPLRIVFPLAVALTAACSDDGPTDSGCTVQSVTVTGLPSLLAGLQSVTLGATIQPASCAGVGVTWSASSGLAVDGDGRVTATHLGGPFTVTATANGVQGTAQTTIGMAPVIADARWALAWANDQAAADYQVSGVYSFSTGGSISSTRSGTGTYAVRFPGLATSPGQRESIQVSAYGSGAPRRCRVASWAAAGNDLVVQVRCHDLSGALADSRFDVLVAPAGSTQGRSAFVVSPATAGDPVPAATAHNSAGKGIRVDRTNPGRYRVTLEGLARESFATAEREAFHVTAHGEGTGWCKIGSWDPDALSPDDLVLQVHCYTVAGVAADAQFSVLMVERGRPGRRLGFVWAQDAAAANYTPSSIYNYSSAGGLNTAARTSAGVYDVVWTGLVRIGGSTPETNLVTAYGSADANYCQVSDWGNNDTVVRCYAPDGTPTNALYEAIWIE